MKKNDDFFINHILDAINKIEKYTANTDYDDFIKDMMKQDAVIREIEIIGEAVKKLSEKYKDKKSNIPWKDIAGMRDKLIHDYFGVDIDAIWETVLKDIPDLKSKIKI